MPRALGLSFAREKDAERVELGVLRSVANRWILLHQLARVVLALGVEHDKTERPVEAPTCEPHAALGISRLEPRRMLLDDAPLLLVRIRKEAAVKRGPDDVRELHAVSL
jgi:hypothetical protein